MSHSEKCPVCSGEGIVKKDTEFSGPENKTCHGCNGKGWITVYGERQRNIKFYPWPSNPCKPHKIWRDWELKTTCGN